MSSSVSKEAMDLYKFAAPALCKKADVKSDLATALVGAIVGGGVGYAANRMTPEDEDEDKKKRLLSNVLAGAAMGGLGGYGLSRLGKRVDGLVDRPGWFQRNWPELGWRHIWGAGAVGGTGYAGYRIKNHLLASTRGIANNVIDPIRGLPDGVDISDVGALKKTLMSDNEGRAALTFAEGYEPASLWKRIISRGVRKSDKARQAGRDAEVLRSLYRIAGKTPPSSATLEALVKKPKYNPRRVIQAWESVRRGHPLHATGRRAAAAALILSLMSAVSYGLKESK